MSYCPECGEQIAKDDVFCPFCGISIKPIAPVEDSSMSETIVDMQPIAINKEALDALTAKSNQETPKTETQNEPVAEQPQTSSESIEKPQDAHAFSTGNTSENWTMKTDSVEIPAEALEDVRSIPLPSVFGDDEPAATAETAAPDAAESSQPLASETVNDSAPTEKTEEAENTDDIPAPAITEDAQTAAVENKFEEPGVSGIIDAPADFQDKKPESLIAEESVESVSDPVGNIENLEEKVEESSPISSNFPASSAESDSNAEISPSGAEESQPISEQSAPVLGSSEEITKDWIEPVEEKVSEPFSQPFAEISAEPEKQETVETGSAAEISEPEAEVSEPPIEMPSLPLILENQDEPTRFDSVQIFQKDEVAEEKIEAAPVDAEIQPAAVEETPVEESKEARPFTTPNIGNSDTDGRKAAKLKPLDEGTILNGRYEIVRKIGGGGMGAVYLANDRNLGGVLRAVKEMVQSYIESEQQDKAVSDFKRESLLLTSLEHSAIPTIYDYFFDEKEGRFYLVMKYISGGDLAGRLRAAPEGRIDEKSVTEWAIQIADVLHYLHNHEPSIVYRDLKPANVMIDGNSGRVMLIDFGIARWVNKEEKGVTAVGTMGYAPPELFSGNVEPRSDIYSLGSTMFHLLTGADPQSNPLLIFDFQKNPRPRQINSQLSDQIEQILIRSVEYNSEARFASAAEMRDALKEHLTNLQIGKVTYGVKVAPSNRAFSEQAVFCGFCGKQIVATDVFCAFCGAQQPIAQQGVSNPSLAVQPMTAKLIIQATGELEPSTFRLEKTENLLGRRDPMSNIFPEVDLSKYDPQTKISRRHARIWREGNSFLVEDLGSSNGTTLLPSSNDSVRLLPHQPHTLTNGDKIRLGDTTLHFTIG
ncbi:MAG TPA: protein kinase [Pyrinomonadaceae bacterium]|nr:protein kinase [Pyrinomonadaceae bacterium]